MFADFVGLYNLSKTLRFELKPVGETLKWIKRRDLLNIDEQRASDYKKLKEIIDQYHKEFISNVLNRVRDLKNIQKYYRLYQRLKKDKNNEKIKEEFEKIQSNLREEIVGFFREDPKFNQLFKEDIIQKLLPEFIRNTDNSTEKKLLLDKFQHWTTYFKNFNENRKNVYSQDNQAAAIGYRIINENLPKFIENLKVFEIIREKIKITAFDKEMRAELRGFPLAKVFSLNYFVKALSQEGIDFYNTIIGGKTTKTGETKLKGLNEYINLFNQKQPDKQARLPKFRQLYKQILSDKQSASFILAGFEKDSELLNAVNDFYKFTIEAKYKVFGKTLDLLSGIKELLMSIAVCDANKIFVRNDAALTNISARLFQDWRLIANALDYSYNILENPNGKKLTLKDKNKLGRRDYISLAEIQQALKQYSVRLDKDSGLEDCADRFKNYFKDCFQHYDKGKKRFSKNALDYQIRSEYKGLAGLLNVKQLSSENKLRHNKQNVAKIKSFLDNIQELFWFIKPLNTGEIDRDEKFYGEFSGLFDALSGITALYNKVRNYLTKKPYSTEKFKLNFENSLLLDGWDVNKEKENKGVLLIKNGQYYLAVIDKQNKDVFVKEQLSRHAASTGYQKVNYKLLPGANKMLPKVFFSDKNIAYFNPSKEISRIRNYGTHTKNGRPQPGFAKREFNIKDCRTMIDFFKESINKHEDWKNFGFKFQPTENYNSINEFYQEVEEQGYKITYSTLANSYIDALVEEGKVYLFQIYNKDFSENKKSNGTDNLHTLYWKALFAEENLQDVVYKLNGEAEIFYRKKSLDVKKPTHPRGQCIPNKNLLNPKKNSKFNYDLIKNKRFTENKFFFHVPININFKARGNGIINEAVNEILNKNKEIKIIGLDRGERHLLYLSLINQKGQIEHQETLNIITTDKTARLQFKVDYHELLDKKEKERDAARKAWENIENIKELKAGYLSQVVHKIAKLMIEHNAIIVLENLNFGFKRGRFKVEKQIYQKFEKMLIDKLNYLVFKKKGVFDKGGLYQAYQLTNKFESFQKLGNQSGFLFYVPAWNTSKIDPETGFVNLLKPKYESVEKSKEFFGKFESIKYNKTEDYFEFAFDYAKFTDKAADTKTEWTVCTCGRERFCFNHQSNTTEKIDVTTEMKKLCQENKIDYEEGSNIKDEIVSVNNKEFYIKLNKYLACVLALRYSDKTSGRDFILSPVKNAKGKFFNSEQADAAQPKDADANGAYHIALKGLWVVRQLQRAKSVQKMNLTLSNKTWLNFVQQKEYNK
jgi:CRISPR-associated protein Cpf1